MSLSKRLAMKSCVAVLYRDKEQVFAFLQYLGFKPLKATNKEIIFEIVTEEGPEKFGVKKGEWLLFNDEKQAIFTLTTEKLEKFAGYNFDRTAG